MRGKTTRPLAEEIVTLGVLCHTHRLAENERRLLHSVSVSKSFQDAWRKVSWAQQQALLKKILLLVTNPSHPSLNAHQLRRSREGIWCCYLNKTQRLLFCPNTPNLHLCLFGSHRIVDTIHAHRYAS